jgi:hypothetical protein
VVVNVVVNLEAAHGLAPLEDRTVPQKECYA